MIVFHFLGSLIGVSILIAGIIFPIQYLLLSYFFTQPIRKNKGYRAPVSGQRRHGEGDGIPEDAEHSYHHEEYHHGHQQESDSIYAELERLRAQVNQLQRQADTFGKVSEK